MKSLVFFTAFDHSNRLFLVSSVFDVYINEIDQIKLIFYAIETDFVCLTFYVLILFFYKKN